MGIMAKLKQPKDALNIVKDGLAYRTLEVLADCLFDIETIGIRKSYEGIDESMKTLILIKRSSKKVINLPIVVKISGIA